MKITFRILSAIMLLSLPVSCGKDNHADSGLPWGGDKKDDGGQTEVSDAEIGKPLPLWSEGCLDIHAINTGRGECTFFILPDGTTMAVDAGEIGTTASLPMTAQKPNSSTRAYQTYARYMQHFLPSAANGKLDYMVISHFHNDHFGTPTEGKYEMSNGYRVTGVTGLYSQLKFNKLIDRIYPDYSEQALVTTDHTSVDSYKTFVDYQKKSSGLKVEKFELGSTTQIALLHKPSDYKFKITNYCANGCIWTGSAVKDIYGSASRAENGSSCGFLLTYGDFDYVTAGDAGMNGKVEVPMAQAIGHRIEAMKAHHHMSTNTMTNGSMSIYRPQVVVTQSLYIRPEEQPHASVLGNLLTNSSYMGEKNFYFTNIDPSVITVKPELYKDSQVKATHGHIVIRVSPGGGQFFVYVLDDTKTDFTVTQIDGPFTCNK